MRLAIPDFNVVQHRSTMLRDVEQNVESVCQGFSNGAVKFRGFIF